MVLIMGRCDLLGGVCRMREEWGWPEPQGRTRKEKPAKEPAAMACRWRLAQHPSPRGVLKESWVKSPVIHPLKGGREGDGDQVNDKEEESWRSECVISSRRQR